MPCSSASCATLRTKSWNCSFLATKSVSELTSTTAPRCALDGDADQAFGGGAAGLLGGGGEALGAQPVDRGFHVAVGLGERLLAVHHAGAGALAQFLHSRGRDLSHVSYPLNRSPAKAGVQSVRYAGLGSRLRREHSRLKLRSAGFDRRLGHRADVLAARRGVAGAALARPPGRSRR